MSYEIENQFLERYEEAPMILVSKGENRRYVEGFLTRMGIDKPEFPGRSLHRPS
ncbi:MAG TPA: hypothetical protein VHA37_00535 [Candidatus Saccharimonadales bacterium]|nr:hypothetical protein [Candidatus Saccharimonadales bacterium]